LEDLVLKFFALCENSMIPNSIDDTQHTEDIFRPKLGSLKDKTTS